MELTLVNQELAEARLFRYSRSFGAFTGRQVADLMFLNTLVLQLLFHIPIYIRYNLMYHL